MRTNLRKVKGSTQGNQWPFQTTKVQNLEVSKLEECPIWKMNGSRRWRLTKQLIRKVQDKNSKVSEIVSRKRFQADKRPTNLKLRETELERGGSKKREGCGWQTSAGKGGGPWVNKETERTAVAERCVGAGEKACRQSEQVLSKTDLTAKDCSWNIINKLGRRRLKRLENGWR